MVVYSYGVGIHNLVKLYIIVLWMLIMKQLSMNFENNCTKWNECDPGGKKNLLDGRCEWDKKLPKSDWAIQKSRNK